MNNLLSRKLRNLPARPGVYIMRGLSDKIIYIGKAASLKLRVKSYFAGTRCRRATTTLKNSFLVKMVRNVEYVLTENVKEALILEEALIKRFQPKYNIMWKDDKRYPYLKVTNEDFPALVITRLKKKDGGKYFGPYPDTTDMRKTLGQIYRIFGLRHCRYNLDKRRKECLYYFMKRCPAPCVGKISGKSYSHIVDNVKMFLSGKTQKLVKSLEGKLHAAKRNLEFEKAAELRDIIFAVKNTIEKINFREITVNDILLNVDRASYLTDLSTFFKRKINRIEGFDISNISGKLAVGSMVVFNNGVPEKKSYRKFRIKTVKKTDDVAMIGEIVKRRYTGSLADKMTLPDLIIIDGGRGHLTSAVSVLEICFNENKMPEIVSIAKCSSRPVTAPILSERVVNPDKKIGINSANEKEKLFFPGNPEPVILPKNSLALNLIKYVRDEAHRFAISYHKHLRAKEQAE